MGVLSNKISLSLKGTGVKKYSAYTIESGQETPVPTEQLIIDKSNKEARFAGSKYVVLTFSEVKNAAMIIDELSYAPTTYDNIVRQRLWRQFYQVADRTINYVEGTTLTPKVEETVPCQICGIVLPLGKITIDHVRPQTGGATEAVAKMLRILGWTVAGPSGHKNTQIQAAVTNAQSHYAGVASGMHQLMTIGSVNAIPTKAGAGRGPQPPATTTLQDRYSLNYFGRIFYSTIEALGALKELKNRSMHSLVNLAPLCTQCNTSRGNPLKF